MLTFGYGHSGKMICAHKGWWKAPAHFRLRACSLSVTGLLTFGYQKCSLSVTGVLTIGYEIFRFTLAKVLEIKALSDAGDFSTIVKTM